MQILVPEREAEEYRQAAEQTGLSFSEWARRALRRARQSQAGRGPDDKLHALDRALGCGHPTGDVDTLLADIERGRDLR